MLTSHHSTQQPPHTQNGEQPRMRPRPRLGNTPTPLPIPSSMQQFFLSFSSYTRHAILHTHSWWVTYQPSPASLYFSLSRARVRAPQQQHPCTSSEDLATMLSSVSDQTATEREVFVSINLNSSPKPRSGLAPKCSRLEDIVDLSTTLQRQYRHRHSSLHKTANVSPLKKKNAASSPSPSSFIIITLQPPSLPASQPPSRTSTSRPRRTGWAPCTACTPRGSPRSSS